MRSDKTAPRSRNASIDGLRGLAALLVVYTHQEALPYSFPLGDTGRIGVLLFFIISGYCIFLAVNKYPRQRLKTFLTKRFFRLYPAYWISILGALAVYGGKYDLPTVLYNFTMVQYMFSAPDILGVYWTLFIEIIFYGVVSILILFRMAGRRAVVVKTFYGFLAFTTLAAAVRYGTSWDLPFGHALFMTTFLFGGVMYFNAEAARPLVNTLMHGVVFLVAILLISALVYNDPSTAQGELGSYDTMSHFGSYLIAILLFFVGTLFLRVETRVTSYLGAISYCIYLFHPIVLAALAPLVSEPSVGSAILALCLIVLTAAMVHHTVEKPLIRLGQMILARGNGKYPESTKPQTGTSSQLHYEETI